MFVPKLVASDPSPQWGIVDCLTPTVELFLQCQNFGMARLQLVYFDLLLKDCVNIERNC